MLNRFSSTVLAVAAAIAVSACASSQVHLRLPKATPLSLASYSPPADSAT